MLKQGKLKSKNKVCLPENGKSVFYINNRNTNAPDVINKIIEEYGKIKELNFIQFGGGAKFYKMLNFKKINKINFFVSTMCRALIKDTFKLFLEIAEKTNGKVRVKTTHCKIVLVNCNDKDFFVIDSSGNFGENKRIEMTEITKNKKYHDFLLNFSLNSFE